MKFKLDENFGTRGQNIFKDSGFDIETVSSENLNGVSDKELFFPCRNEKRCLVTLDKDFSDIINFNPKELSGIVVVRMPANPSIVQLENLIKQFITALKTNILENHLWIIEPGRIRIRKSLNEEEN